LSFPLISLSFFISPLFHPNPKSTEKEQIITCLRIVATSSPDRCRIAAASSSGAKRRHRRLEWSAAISLIRICLCQSRCMPPPIRLESKSPSVAPAAAVLRPPSPSPSFPAASPSSDWARLRGYLKNRTS
ncbi:hypothetical protein LINPERHAP1_LOCUS21700, partial [Linum perenne]